jgi:hypothetical protein
MTGSFSDRLSAHSRHFSPPRRLSGKIIRAKTRLMNPENVKTCHGISMKQLLDISGYFRID